MLSLEKFCKADLAASYLPVVILTLAEANESLIAALAGGTDNYIVKSIDVSVILALIPTQLSIRHVCNPNLRLRQELIDRAKTIGDGPGLIRTSLLHLHS